MSFLFSSEELAGLRKLIVGPIEAYLELLNLVNLTSADVKV